MSRFRGTLIVATGDVEPYGYLAAWNSTGQDLDKAHHVKRGLKVAPEDTALWVTKFGDRLSPLIDSAAKL